MKGAAEKGWGGSLKLRLPEACDSDLIRRNRRNERWNKAYLWLNLPLSVCVCVGGVQGGIPMGFGFSF